MDADDDAQMRHPGNAFCVKSKEVSSNAVTFFCTELDMQRRMNCLFITASGVGNQKNRGGWGYI
jgi:hypothetical protein